MTKLKKLKSIFYNSTSNTSNNLLKLYGSKFFSIASLVVFSASLLTLVSLSLKPVEVKAFSALVYANDDVIIAGNQSSNQHFRDHLGAGYTYYDGSWGQGASLIKFNNLNLPAGAIVTSASLNLRQYSHSIPGASNPVLYASGITSSWTPTSTVWSSAPGLANNGVAEAVAGGSRAFDLDITDIAKSWNVGNPNYGVSVRSDSTSNGSWLCSVRIVGIGGSSYCSGFTSSLSINYILNSPPNVPVLDSSLLSSNDAHGGFPYIGGIVRTNNPVDSSDDLTQNCVQNNGCDVKVRFTNFGDPDQAPGNYDHSEIILEPVTPPGGYASVGVAQNIYWPSTAEFNQTINVKDGYYKVYAKSIDRQNAISTSNFAILKVDTTAPISSEIVTLPEFSKGTQLLVKSTTPGDFDSLSNPVKYDFCRTDSIDLNNLTPFSGGTSSTPTDADFTNCSSTGVAGIITDPLAGVSGNYQDSPFFGFGNLEDGKKYYFVVRSKDQVDPSSPDRANIGQFSSPKATIMDATNPIISNQTLVQDGQNTNGTRISPINLDGIKDETTVKFDVNEANLSKVSYQLKNVQTGAIESNIELFNFSANVDKSVNTSANTKSFTDIFAGKNEALNNILDGTYSVIISAQDKAGNTSVNEDLVISIDNMPGKINISLPSQNAFTNNDNQDISGQVLSGDNVLLDECKITVSGNITACNLQNLAFNNVVNEDYFFTKNYNLDLGENTFAFRSTDSVFNQQEKTLKITREEEAPVISEVQLNSQILNINGEKVLSKNRRPTVQFSLQDLNTQNYGQSGIDGNSLNLKIVNNQNQEVNLVQNGVNASSLGNMNSSCSDVNSQPGDFVTGQINCNFGYSLTSDLQPDGEWKFAVSGKDKAGNNFSYDKTILNLDSFTFVENSTPSSQAIFARKKVHFEGKGEQGATLQFSNSELQSLGLSEEKFGVKIVLDESNNGKLGKTLSGNSLLLINSETYQQSDFEIDCNTNQDFDNSALTTNPICTWKVDLLQNSTNNISDPNLIKVNDNVITILDLAGNTQTLTKTISVNLFSVNLSFAPSASAGKQYGTTFISTDGNGKQDGIYFEGAISNPDNISDPVLVDTWTLTFKNSDGVIVRTISGSNSLPPSLIFDGKTDANSTSGLTQNLPDGNYTWNLDLNSLDNANLPNISGAFQNITKNTPGVFIAYPSGASSNSPFITSSGVTEVQGQANLFAGLSNEDVQVRICVDTLGLTGTCDFEQIASVNSEGYFSVIVALPKITSDPANPGVTNHIIQATIVDKFGNEGLPSNQVFVRNNPVDPFVSVQSIPTFSGINTADKIGKIEDLQSRWLTAKNQNPVDQNEIDNIKLELENEINSAKKLILRSTVTADTQYVKLSYSDLTNLSELTGNEAKKKIGWIDNNTFEFTKNILGDVKFNSAGDPQTTPCPTAQCTWDVEYPVPSFSGGLYEVNFTGRKGNIEQTLSAGVWLDANILTTPTIYDINKIIGPTSSNPNSTTENTKLYNGKYYSNSLTNEIKGFADPSTNISIIDTSTGNVICQTVTSEISIFSCTLNTSSANPNASYKLKVVATKGTKTVESLEDTHLVVDTVAPSLVAYRNLNNNNSDIVNKYLCESQSLPITQLPATPSIILGATPNGIYCNSKAGINGGMPNGFNRQSGDTVEVELESDEVLDYGKITNQNEQFRYQLSSVANAGKRPETFSPYFAVNGIFQIEGFASQGKYQVKIKIADLAGNVTQTTQDYNIDNAAPNTPDQDFSLWGNLTGFDRRAIASPVNNSPSYYQPANNRLLQIDNQKNYVLKDDSVLFYGYAEENTYPVLSINNTDIVATNVVASGCSSKTQVNNVDLDNQETIATDGTVVQSKTHCLYAVEVKFEELYLALLKSNALNSSTQGTKPGASSKAEGVYLVQWRSEDKSGNRSEYSRQYLLEYDKTTPQYFSIEKAYSGKFNPIIDWQTNGALKTYSDGRGNLPAITNQLDLSLDAITEQQTDVEYFLLDNSGKLVSSQSKKFINPTNQKHTVSFNLGDKTADKDGQQGLAQDGIYQICYNSGDSADNEIGLNCFNVERDTLTPNKPKVSLSLNFQYKNEPYTISGNVSGESYTTSNLVGNIGKSGNKTGTVKTLSVNNDADWEKTFTFCSNLADRATNTSGNTCKTITTPVRPPRAGECNLTDNQKSTIKDYIKTLVDPNQPLPDLGFSKSCNVYEPNLIQSQVSSELQTQVKAKTEASSCVQANELNNLRKQTDFIGPVAGNKTCDTSLLTSDEINNIKTAYQDSIDSYKQAKADYQKAKKELEEQQAKQKAEAEKKKCSNDFNIFSGDNCLTKGLVDGTVSVFTGIADFATGIVKDFQTGDYLSGIGKIMIVVGVIALTIVAAPFVATAVSAGLAVVGVGGTVGTIATTIITGAVIGATINTVSAVASATNISFNPPSASFDTTKFTQTLTQNFCGTSSEPNLGTCLGYFAGQVLTGEALAAGIGGVAKTISSVTKSGEAVNVIGKSLSKIGETTDDVAKVTDDISKVLDDLAKTTDNLNKTPNLTNLDDTTNALQKAADDLDNLKNKNNGVDDTQTKPKNSDEPGGGCVIGSNPNYNALIAFFVGVRVEAQEGCVPNYIKDNLVPNDAETVLINKTYTKTSKFYDGASIYKDADGNYYYRDKLHTGKAAHIEIFNKNGKHLGEMKPNGELIPNSADPKKILPKEKR